MTYLISDNLTNLVLYTEGKSAQLQAFSTKKRSTSYLPFSNKNCVLGLDISYKVVDTYMCGCPRDCRPYSMVIDYHYNDDLYISRYAGNAVPSSMLKQASKDYKQTLI